MLEKTINELTEEGETKNKYIGKLKEVNKAFLEEATLRKEECNAIIKKQDEIIKELNDHICQLEHLIRSNKKETKTINTQTDFKKLSTTSTQTKKSHKTVSTSTENIVQESCKDINTDGSECIPSHVSPSNISTNNSTSLNSTKEDNIYFQRSKSISRILILSDDYGRNINKVI